MTYTSIKIFFFKVFLLSFWIKIYSYTKQLNLTISLKVKFLFLSMSQYLILKLTLNLVTFKNQRNYFNAHLHLQSELPYPIYKNWKISQLK